MNNLTKKSEGLISFKSSNPFEFFHIIKKKKVEEQEVFGSLIFPKKRKAKNPLVICIHGSLGWRGHHHEHIANFLENGFAIFRVHSFEARNVSSIVEDQMQVTLATTMTDCFNALNLLVNHPSIDPKRVAIAGWSLGGSSALYSAYEPLIQELSPQGNRFKAHLAFYPGAYILPEEMKWSSSPILNLVGQIDDYTPPILIKNLSTEINKHNGNSELIIYPNAHHSFDSVEPVIFEKNAIGCGIRPSLLDSQGNLYFMGKDGSKYLLNEPNERAQLFKTSKNIKGAHLGGNWEAREASKKDSINFLVKSLQSS